MLPNILKETVRGIQPILIEDEMLQHKFFYAVASTNIDYGGTILDNVILI